MPNWTTIGLSRPSPARMRSICSAFAASPAMIAAGSPGVRRSSMKTSTATMSSTGIVDSSLLRIKAYITKRPLAGPLCKSLGSVLLHIPVNVARPDDPAGHVLARGDWIPVHRLQVDLEAGLAQELRRDVRQLLDRGEIRRLHDDDRRAVVARGLQQLLGLFHAGLGLHLAALGAAVGGIAGEHRRARPVELLDPDLRAQERLLRQRRERRLAHFRVVERRMQVVEAAHVL